MVLNVGNSRTAVGAFVAGELQLSKRLDNANRQEWPAVIAEVWAKVSGGDSPAVAGASVNPPLVEALEHVVHQQTSQLVQWVGREIGLPIKVLTAVPAETGVDRVLNIAAAYEQMQKACVVVDAGTCVTVNCCNDAGEFLGGAIAPGVRMMLDALHEKTARLPQVEFAVPTEPFGNSTAGAIQQGVYHGIRGMVKELVENYATALGNWPDIIATGGDAEKLFKDWELIHAIAPDLTLYGIALAYVEHQIKQDGQ